jgi:hypothetical protein
MDKSFPTQSRSRVASVRAWRLGLQRSLSAAGHFQTAGQMLASACSFTKSYTDETTHDTNTCGHIAETDVTISVLQVPSFSPDVWGFPVSRKTKRRTTAVGGQQRSVALATAAFLAHLHYMIRGRRVRQSAVRKVAKATTIRQR